MKETKKGYELRYGRDRDIQFSGDPQPTRYRTYFFLAPPKGREWDEIVTHVSDTQHFIETLRRKIGQEKVLAFVQDIISCKDGAGRWDTQDYCCTVFWVPEEQKDCFLQPYLEPDCEEQEVICRVVKKYRLSCFSLKDYTYDFIKVPSIVHRGIKWATIVMSTLEGVRELDLGLDTLKEEYTGRIRFDIPGKRVDEIKVDSGADVA